MQLLNTKRKKMQNFGKGMILGTSGEITCLVLNKTKSYEILESLKNPLQVWF